MTVFRLEFLLLGWRIRTLELPDLEIGRLGDARDQVIALVTPCLFLKQCLNMNPGLRQVYSYCISRTEMEASFVRDVLRS